MTYTEIITAVQSYMHRTDLAAKMPDFVKLAEAVLFRELNLREFDTSITGTAVDGYITLPADFGSLSRITSTLNGVETNLQYIDRPDDYTNGQAYCYSQEKGQLRLFPFSSSQAYTLYYKANLVPLSVSNANNWLSINAADLYVYATALEGSKWTRDGDQITILTPIVASLIESVRALSNRRTQPDRGGLVVKIKQPLR